MIRVECLVTGKNCNDVSNFMGCSKSSCATSWRGLAPVLAIFFAVAGLPISGTADPARRCIPIGRIVGSGNGSVANGRIICLNEQLNLPDRSIRLLCFANRETVTLQGRIQVDERTCSPRGFATKSCGASRCFRPKGPGDSEFRIIQPGTTALMDQRPTISWNAVPNATDYVVWIVGNGVRWEKRVSETALLYPVDEADLQMGNAYRIVVIARRNGKTLSTTETVLNIVRL